VGIALCNVYYRQEDNMLSDDDCGDLVVAYRSMFAIQCVELDQVLGIPRHRERKGLPRLHADFDCATKICIYQGHSNATLPYSLRNQYCPLPNRPTSTSESDSRRTLFPSAYLRASPKECLMLPS
jgi:hypothetical protein